MTEVPDLLPARILNEHVYCPRLAYLEWVDGGFTDNADTVEGTLVHRRVDEERGQTPAPEDLDGEGEDPPPTTSLTLSSEELGLIAKIDLVEFSKGKAHPLEYKRGKPRSAEEPLWEPELVQLCAQVLLLRGAGYKVDGAESSSSAAPVTRSTVPRSTLPARARGTQSRSMKGSKSAPAAPSGSFAPTLPVTRPPLPWWTARSARAALWSESAFPTR
jgi:hypothetical protein